MQLAAEQIWQITSEVALKEEITGLLEPFHRSINSNDDHVQHLHTRKVKMPQIFNECSQCSWREVGLAQPNMVTVFNCQ